MILTLSLGNNIHVYGQVSKISIDLSQPAPNIGNFTNEIPIPFPERAEIQPWNRSAGPAYVTVFVNFENVPEWFDKSAVYTCMSIWHDDRSFFTKTIRLLDADPSCARPPVTYTVTAPGQIRINISENPQISSITTNCFGYVYPGQIWYCWVDVRAVPIFP